MSWWGNPWPGALGRLTTFVRSSCCCAKLHTECRSHDDKPDREQDRVPRVDFLFNPRVWRPQKRPGRWESP